MRGGGNDLVIVSLELALFFTFVLSVALNGVYPAMTSLAGMGVMAIPWVLRRRGILDLPWPVTLAAGAVLLLHSLGILFMFYDRMWWWDTMTHMMATVIIALVTSLALFSLDIVAPDLRMPARLVPSVTLACVLVLGVIWEVLEFVCDGALGLNMQYSLDDSATDLSFDILGGGLVVLILIPLLDIVNDASHRMFPWKRTSSAGSDEVM